MTAVPSITLNNGVQMPALGLGVFQTPPEETTAAVLAALEMGYTHVDTAASYANERGVGDALRQSSLDRSDVFVETKVWISDYGDHADVACLREERGQARRRPDRLADSPPGPAVGLPEDARRLSRARDAACHRQGSRDRGQQLHGRPPRCAARARDGGAGGQPDRGSSVLRAARRAGPQRGAADPHAGVVADRRHHLLSRHGPRQHSARPGHRRDRWRPTARRPLRSCCAGTCSRAAQSSRSRPARRGSPRTSTSSTSSSATSSLARSMRSTPPGAVGQSPPTSPSRPSHEPQGISKAERTRWRWGRRRGRNRRCRDRRSGRNISR